MAILKKTAPKNKQLPLYSTESMRFYLLTLTGELQRKITEGHQGRSSRTLPTTHADLIQIIILNTR